MAFSDPGTYPAGSVAYQRRGIIPQGHSQQMRRRLLLAGDRGFLHLRDRLMRLRLKLAARGSEGGGSQLRGQRVHCGYQDLSALEP
jgi:hypothetical protein